MSSPSEEIKSRLDIVEIVSGYLKLQKSGTAFKALCPFHREKTPSFHVSREKQIWHCFGCGEGGDIFKFVMKMDGIEFPDALRLLAGRAGVVLRSEDPTLRSERARLQELAGAAMRFFEERLADPDAADVREYLARRSLTEETRQNFHLGYAPEGWDTLVRHLRWKSFRESEAERAGLAIRTERGWHDRFRNRIMFPLFDIHGNPVGFSGRIFEPRVKEEAVGGKYINTPETLIYQKSRLLYGLDRAKQSIREQKCAILVEGQFDLVLSHQAGLLHTVSTSGTALTEDHARLLRRYTDAVHTAFDSDEAGALATRRSVELLLAQDLAVRVIVIEGGKDPADLVAADPDRWRRSAGDPVSAFDHFLQQALRTSERGTPEGRRRVAEALLPLVWATANPVVRGTYLRRLAEALGVQERFVYEMLQRFERDARATGDAASAARSSTDAGQPRPRTRWTEIEEYLLALLWKYPALFEKISQELSEELFSESHTRAIFVQLYRQRQDVELIPGILAEFPEEARTDFNRMVLKLEEYLNAAENVHPENELAFFLQELVGRRLRSEQHRLAESLRESESGLRREEREELLRRFSALSEKLRNIERLVIISAGEPQE